MIWTHIDLDWRFSTQFPSAMAAEITCKLRPLCILIGYWIYHQIGYTESYLFAFAFLLHIYYGTFSFNNGLPSHLITSHRGHTQGSTERSLEDCLENCLAEDLYELHACFTMGLDLWEKVHTMGTCDTQICMQRMHTWGTRRRSSDLKEGDCVTVPTHVTTHISAYRFWRPAGRYHSFYHTSCLSTRS